MAVVGVDFGTLASKIGVARHRGIDIIANEVSNRATPSLVAFGPKQRHIGESAKTQETSNFKNTIGSLKRLLGRSLSDPEVTEVEAKFLNAKLVDVGGTIGVDVSYLGERAQFSFTQLAGMYLAKIRDITAAELKTGVSDIVISVPVWFTDVQRRAMLDAAQIAGLNALRLINEPTATALGYGITKTDLPEPENPRHVAFVDVGHSSMSVTIVAYSKGRLDVKGTAFDRNLGGRDIDYALVQHFSEEFKSKYKIDVLSSPKATFRLAAGCEKLKKVLSANAEAPLNVESIMNDVDASSKLNREDYEALIAHVLDRIAGPCQQALTASGLTAEQIDVIELVGGSSRIPAVKARVASVFNKPLSTTLNQDEAVARGAAFCCAMLSPTFRVREFSMGDQIYYPIKFSWPRDPTDPVEDLEMQVFAPGNKMPSTKVLSFSRSGPFELEAVYEDASLLPGSMNPWIGKFTAKNVPLLEAGSPANVRVRTRVDANGILGFSAAYVEELIETPAAPGAMDVDGKEATSKKTLKKHDVSFITAGSSLDITFVEQFKEREAQMHSADKLVVDTEDRKNALEEYVYDTRGKLDDRYSTFVQAEEKEKLITALSAAEDWLYTEEGEDATKSAYVAKLDELKKLGDPITFRWREAEDRRAASSQLRETINSYMTQASSGEERFAHIDQKDLQSIVEKCATVQKWLEDQSVRQSEKPKNVDPVLTTAEIAKKREEIIYFSTPILTRPKPKAPKTDAPPPPPAQDSEMPPAATGEEGTAPPPPPPKNETETAKDEVPNMDVD